MAFDFLQEFNNKKYLIKPIAVMLSSSSNPKDISKAIDLNVKDYLYKPLDIGGIEKF